MSHYSEQREFDRISGRDNNKPKYDRFSEIKPGKIVKWTQQQIDRLGADKGFLPEAYWPDDYVHGRPEQPYTPTSWDRRWIDLVNLVSSWSKDRSTKVGSVIVDDRNTLVSMGWNGFPRGIDDAIEARHSRPAKYEWTEHAERNAIYNAAATGANIRGCTMYLAWYPCADCARGIIQSGITKVVCVEPDWNHQKFDFKVSREMLKEAGVTVNYFNTSDEQFGGATDVSENQGISDYGAIDQGYEPNVDFITRDTDSYELNEKLRGATRKFLAENFDLRLADNRMYGVGVIHSEAANLYNELAGS